MSFKASASSSSHRSWSAIDSKMRPVVGRFPLEACNGSFVVPTMPDFKLVTKDIKRIPAPHCTLYP